MSKTFAELKKKAEKKIQLLQRADYSGPGLPAFAPTMRQVTLYRELAQLELSAGNPEDAAAAYSELNDVLDRYMRSISSYPIRHVGNPRDADKPTYEMTNSEIKKEYAILEKKSSAMVDKLIDAGYGTTKPSEMREKRKENPLFNEYISILDQMGDLKSEAVARYGPDLGSVSQLGRGGSPKRHNPAHLGSHGTAKGSTTIQTLIFDRAIFNKRMALSWAKAHGFKSSKVDETKKSYRLRQESPQHFKTMRTIELRPGVKAVIGK